MTNKTKWLYILLGLLVGLGLCLRFYDLSQPSYWLDEGYTISAVQATLKHGYPLLASGMVYDRDLLNTYSTALPVLIFGAHPWTYRLMSVLFGAGVIVLVYLLTLALFNKKSLALISAGFITLSTWEIFWSRQARGYTELQFFYLLSILCLVKLLKNFQLKNFIWFIILAIVTALTHDSGIIVLPLGLLILIWHYRKDVISELNHSWRKYWWLGLLLGIGLILIANKTLGFINLLMTKKTWTTLSYLYLLLVNYGFILITSLIGLGLLMLKKSERTTVYIFSLFYFLALLLTISTTDFLEFRYVFFIFPLMIILMIYTITTAWPCWEKHFWGWLIVLIIVVAPNFNKLEFTPKSLDAFDAIPHPNFNLAYSAIKSELSDSDIIISPYIPLDMAYLGRSDYFLEMSFSGKPAELENYKKFPYDLYHKKPLIKNVEELKSIIREHHGFVIFDQLAYNRLGEQYLSLLQKQCRQIFYEDKQPNSSIWVFTF